MYRIIQEALHNINKYAEAKKVTISISQNNQHISVEINDDGKGFDVSSIKNKDGSSSPKRVFLARKNFIRKYNQDEIIKSLSQFDFSFIYMEDLEFHEQVYIMSRAELIVGPTGAAWTNILFATSGAKALCWMASEAGDLSCFSNIASALDVKLYYINYCAGESDTRSIYYAPYKIDVNIIVDWVRHHIYESLSSNLGR